MLDKKTGISRTHWTQNSFNRDINWTLSGLLDNPRHKTTLFWTCFDKWTKNSLNMDMKLPAGQPGSFCQRRQKRMLSSLRKVMNLSPENVIVIDAINQTLDWLRRKGTPGRQRADFAYARIARVAFDGICELMAEGFSYVTICKAFEANGLLPEGSKPYSLSRAVRREDMRRQKRAAPARSEQVLRDATKRMENVKTDSSDKGVARTEPENPKFSDHAEKIERIRKEDGFAVDTGLGKLTKHSDGSFDFDWK
jgi:hypothetical protein